MGDAAFEVVASFTDELLPNFLVHQINDIAEYDKFEGDNVMILKGLLDLGCLEFGEG